MPNPPSMKRITGIPVSKGLVIGRVYLLEEDRSFRVGPQAIDEMDAPAQLERFELARRAAIADLDALHEESTGEMGSEAAKIFLFHIGALNDPTILKPIRSMIEQDHVTPEYATSFTLRKLAARFAKHPDSTFQSKVDDLRDLAARLLSKLSGKSAATLASVGKNTIIIARDLTPTQTAGFNREHVTGFVTDLGGRTSHTAIVAGALSLPAVVGAKNITTQAHDGQQIIVDGNKGTIILDPDEDTIAQYQALIQTAEEARISLHELAELPAITTDGVEIELLGNIEFADEIPHLLDEGGQGVGLYRTEFLYLTGKQSPTEEDQFNAYKQCIEHLKGKPFTIRTFDLGADKYTQRQEETPERNPFLGLRSIRYSLQNQKMFRTQLRAILRASALGPIKIMFPLITNITEFRSARYFLNEEMEELAEAGIKYNPNIEVGMMVEVPAAALMASTFAQEVDFFSVGTNDLVQYTLAVDRTNERVASLYTPIHPAVLRLVRDVTRAGRKRDIPVSCCGQSAADPAFAALLIGMGVRTLSVTASSLPLVKRAIRGLSVTKCERIAKRAIGFDSEAEASSYVFNRLRKIVPEVFDGRTVG
ncbi:MAG: phosphoenolpyruvate--protein phosphotransferase [Phycisphaerales bacterium]|nr:phosphoenolpyruvate--protein phosphotransferase [Phycisphaerales bacterium]